MTPIGSAGDVHPFVGIGRALQQRGHRVTIITNAAFASVVEKAGLDFVAHGSVEFFEAVTQDPELWHPTRGVGFILRTIAQLMREQYELIEHLYEPGQTVLVNHSTGVGSRVFEDKYQLPALTVHLAPSVFRSAWRDPTQIPGHNLSWLPWTIRRGMWWLIDRMLIDRHVLGELNRWRAELGLPPVSRIFKDWLHSPQRVIGLFPDWFAPPQPDWPAALRLTGFPLFDERGQHAADPALEAFLQAGDPPIAATPGSANRQASAFFEAVIEAAARLRRRALLLTRYPEQLPASLPDHVLHVPFAPFSTLLPRCAAVIHHAGIGSCAQGLAAGIPQFAMPMGFDQPDNVARLQALGVGTFVTPQRFTGRNVARALRPLLESHEVREACRRCAERIAADDAIARTCDLIEAMIPTPRSRAVMMAT